ncbi:MAG: hypothetical protein B7X28_03315 [Halothiobacillus sp. 13-55-253]|nr:MAG: hypothetical protein B7X28_03315 [Halothiobacillus sp. 13-55-253]
MEMLLLGIVVLLVAQSAYADGGGPLLLLMNFMLFTYGQVWILLSETLVFKKVFPASPTSAVIKWVVLANLASTLVGALLAPLVWAAVFGLLGHSLWDNEIGKWLFAIGTWIAGDNSPHPNVAIGVSMVGFILTFFLTVYIEKRVYVKAISKNELPVAESLLSRCYLANGISYAGLVLLFLMFTDW